MSLKGEDFLFFMIIAVAVVICLMSGGLRAIFEGGAEEYLCQATLSPASLVSFMLIVGIYIRALVRPIQIPRNAAPAGLGRRILAFIVDYVSAAIILGVPFTFVVLVVEASHVGEFVWHFTRTEPKPTDEYFRWVVLLLFVALLFYFALPVYRKKQSLGQVVTHMILDSSTPLTLPKALLRSALGFIVATAAWISIPWAWTRKDKRMWHDTAFGTYPKVMPEKI